MDELLSAQYEEPCQYCIRCGKVLSSKDIYYSKDDPDGEEPLCYDCYKLTDR